MSEPKPDGWHALAGSEEHALDDGLFIGGQCVATLQAFFDGGPFYANAMTPQGEHKRLGAGESHSAAAEWCERVTSYRVALAEPTAPR